MFTAKFKIYRNGAVSRDKWYELLLSQNNYNYKFDEFLQFLTNYYKEFPDSKGLILADKNEWECSFSHIIDPWGDNFEKDWITHRIRIYKNGFRYMQPYLWRIGLNIPN